MVSHGTPGPAGPEPVARGISLWLAPEPEGGAALRLLITRLATGLGTPPFEPHVTLLAGLTRSKEEVLRRAEGVAAGLEGSLVLSLGGALGSDAPFRCLYLPVGPTLNLLTAQALARAAFGQVEEGQFEPHLSLVYGRLEAARRLALAHEIAAEVPGRVRFDGLEVVRTAGPVSEWRRLARFPLGSPAVGQDRPRD